MLLTCQVHMETNAGKQILAVSLFFSYYGFILYLTCIDLHFSKLFSVQ